METRIVPNLHPCVITVPHPPAILSAFSVLDYTGLFLVSPVVKLGSPGGSDGKESACNAGDLGLTLGLEDSLEKSTATHSSIRAWRSPWTEEPGGLLCMGSRGIGHD